MQNLIKQQIRKYHLSKVCLKFGELQVLCLFLSPSPQLAEQEVHGCHSLQNGQKCCDTRNHTKVKHHTKAALGYKRFTSVRRM